MFVQRDSLFAKAGDEVLWLRHFHYNVFDPFEKSKAEGIDTSGGAGPTKFQFIMNTAGDIESVSIPFEAGLKPLIFTRQLKAKEVKGTDLKKYVGDYDLNGATVKVYVKDDKTLFVLVPGQPDYELVPLGNDKFGLKVVAGYFVQFAMDDKGKVTELTFMQPNGNFKAMKK